MGYTLYTALLSECKGFSILLSSQSQVVISDLIKYLYGTMSIICHRMHAASYLDVYAQYTKMYREDYTVSNLFSVQGCEKLQDVIYLLKIIIW